ncbi:hypothetical protein [Terricaulis sp.]|uniref:hypothetical protein n=1 Tax=Terricaulis sp. TaxID=2768686 RepID=UPI003783DF5D
MSQFDIRQSALALGAVGVILCAPLAAAQTPANQGDWIVDARLRYEGVSQDGLEDAQAVTLRARLGYETPSWHGWRALAELEGVAHLSEDFNDTVNGETAFAVVPDPEAFELNRLQVSWSGAEGRRAVIGRQRIVLGNARFVGNVGFRQNEQTFDALNLSFRPFSQTTVTYIYLERVRRIFGDDSPQGEWDSDSHVIQAEASLPFGRLTGYGLLLDFQNAPAQSSQTYGVRWQNEWNVGGYRPRFVLEAAQQSDYRGNTAPFDLGYQLVEAGVRRGQWAATIGGERLEGNGTRGFATPLATLHAFQGWADVFLTTPPDGVRDLYAGASYTTAPWPAEQPATVSVVYHDFTDDGGSADFGDEWDASVRFSLSEHVALEAKAAVFDGDDPRFADRNKFWLAVEYRL